MKKVDILIVITAFAYINTIFGSDAHSSRLGKSLAPKASEVICEVQSIDNFELDFSSPIRNQVLKEACIDIFLVSFMGASTQLFDTRLAGIVGAIGLGMSIMNVKHTYTVTQNQISDLEENLGLIIKRNNNLKTPINTIEEDSKRVINQYLGIVSKGEFFSLVKKFNRCGIHQEEKKKVVAFWDINKDKLFMQALNFDQDIIRLNSIQRDIITHAFPFGYDSSLYYKQERIEKCKKSSALRYFDQLHQEKITCFLDGLANDNGSGIQEHCKIETACIMAKIMQQSLKE